MRRNLRSFTRRAAIGRLAALGTVAAAMLALAPLSPAAAQVPAAGQSLEKVYGDPNAPVTVVEYASLACSHCADFHKTVWPKLKAEFIDTGQVKLIFRDFPLNAPGLRAAQLAHCSGPRYEAMKDVLFKSQASWLSREFEAQLAKIARMAGMPQDKFQACLADKQLEEALIQSQLVAVDKDKVSSTPTFIVNGKERIEGVNEEALFKALEKAGAKRKAG